jgi:membrane protein
MDIHQSDKLIVSAQRLARQVRDVVRYAVRRADQERLAQVAGSLTFTTTLSLVPLLAIVIAIVTGLPAFGHMQDSLRSFLVQNLMPEELSDSIMRYLNQFSAKARGLTVIGLFFLAVTSVSTMLTVDRALNTIWRVSRPRPLARRILVYWAALTIGPVLLAVSISVTSYLAGASVGMVKQPPVMLRIVIDLIPLIALSAAYAALYVYVPNRLVRWRDALIGGFCAALAFELAKRGFAIYVARFPTYTMIYGALAALPIFLLWVYLSWLITLFGATVAASLPTLYERTWNRGQAVGEAYGDALRVVRALYSARNNRLPGMSMDELQQQARLGWNESLPILERLEADGLVIRTRPIAQTGPTATASQDLWIFAADPAVITLDRLFRLFVFDGRAVASAGFEDDDPLASLVAQTSMHDPRETLASVLLLAPKPMA